LAGDEPYAGVPGQGRSDDGFSGKIPGQGRRIRACHHSDRGVQLRPIRYGETLAESEIVASVGSRGDSYDNAMAEALNSVYKAELIDRKVWSGLIEVMAETSKWVAWYNQSRLHSAIDYRPPIEVHSEWIN